MDCFCGCGTRVERGMVATQLQAGAVALELLAWDKARNEGRFSGSEAEQIDSLIHRGSLQYQRLLDAIHGDRAAAPIDEGEAWLAESEDLRADRQYMTERSWLKKGRPLRLTDEEMGMIDRKHPELTFSEREATPQGAAEPDVASQLERLAALHAEGVLSDEELAAAKRRVLEG